MAGIKWHRMVLGMALVVVMGAVLAVVLGQTLWSSLDWGSTIVAGVMLGAVFGVAGAVIGMRWSQRK